MTVPLPARFNREVKAMSRWSSSFVIAVTLLLGTLSSTPAHAVDLNLCQSPAESPFISLPADEAPHDVHDEWYYTTGHLWTLSGKRYGFETVVFQLPAPTPPGGFITVGQVAVTDLNNGTFHQEFFGPLFAPFPPSTDSFEVTVEGLTMSGGDGSNHITASLTDNDGDYGIDLSLSAVKNPVYQADDGLIHYDDPDSSTQYY
jgi:predicted secreted hydrolase